MPDYQVSDKSERLNKVFADKKISQARFGKLLELHPTTINKLLAGTQTIGLNISNKICQRLDLNPTWWETGEGEMYLPKKPAEQKPAESMEAENLLRQLVETQQELIKAQRELLEERRQKQDKQTERLKNNPVIPDKP